MQLIPDGLEEDVAQVMMFYRWRRSPMLQLLLTLRRQTVDGDMISYSSDDGLPLVVLIRLSPDESDPQHATQVIFNVEYKLPQLLVDFAGKFGVHMHVDGILQQNIEVCCNAGLCCNGDVTHGGLCFDGGCTLQRRCRSSRCMCFVAAGACARDHRACAEHSFRGAPVCPFQAAPKGLLGVSACQARAEQAGASVCGRKRRCARSWCSRS
jgi:hypothetical protein